MDLFGFWDAQNLDKSQDNCYSMLWQMLSLALTFYLECQELSIPLRLTIHRLMQQEIFFFRNRFKKAPVLSATKVAFHIEHSSLMVVINPITKVTEIIFI